MWTREGGSTADPDVHVLPVHMQSAPFSPRFVQNEGMDGSFAQHQCHQPYTATVWSSAVHSRDRSSPIMGFSKYQLIPQPQSLPITGVLNKSGTVDYTGTINPLASSTVTLPALTPPSSFNTPITTLGLTNSLNLEYTSRSPCAADFSSTKTAGWWNDDMMQTAQMYCPTYCGYSVRTSYDMLVSMVGLNFDMSNFSAMSEYPLQPEMQSYHPAMCPAPSGYSETLNMVSVSPRPLLRPSSPLCQSYFDCRRPSGHTKRPSVEQSCRKSSVPPHGPADTPFGESAGFVNFTPDDSRKILAGVAPSGSSKTKARREKEAIERRKRRSQTAVKPGIKACGSVDCLRTLGKKELHA